MRKRATTLFALLLVLPLAASTVTMAHAAQDNDEEITVTLLVNTSTVVDTLSADDIVQVRGAIRGHDWENEEYLDQIVRWSNESTLIAENIGGDYWMVSLQMLPGDTLDYKFWTGYALDPEEPAGGGWESSPDRVFDVPEDQTEDITLDLSYYNQEVPFDDPPEDHFAVFFRVNIGAEVALGNFDPENEDHVVGLRGDPDGVLYQLDWGETEVTLEREDQPESNNHFYSGAVYVHQDSLVRNAGQQEYKFVFNTPDINWEADPNRAFTLEQAADTTLQWVFFSERRPPVGETVEASVQFTVNMGVLEDLGFFSRAIGDEVLLVGGFNQWDTSEEAPAMVFEDAFGVYQTTIVHLDEPGTNLEYKFFVRWNESRFDEESENYIAGLSDGNGWEEPGVTGGGNRIYTFTSEDEQFAGDFGGTVGFFNSIPPQGVIMETESGAETMDVTFKVDMTPALTWDGLNFDPENHGVWIQFDVPFFALTQGIPTGIAGIEEDPDRVSFSASEDGDNIYELTLEVQLPTENHIGFNIVYGDLDGDIQTSGNNSFEAGRRYYRYVEPLSVDGDVVTWPDNYELALIEFKEEADFEDPPQYGLGVSIEDDSVLPERISLYQNYPNPFNPSTTISYTLPQASDVLLTVYNMLGQQVVALVDARQVSGSYQVSFDGANLSSGVYVYRLEIGGQILSRKMILMK